jgi:hypothetical protein
MPSDSTTPNERWRIIGPLYLAPPDAAITQDWSMLEASQESLREHMLEIARLRAENERLREAGVGYSQQTVDALTKERDTLRSQLPDDMQNCTIVLERCDVGHGWLHATNWMKHRCPYCKIDTLRELVRDAFSRKGDMMHDHDWLQRAEKALASS